LGWASGEGVVAGALIRAEEAEYAVPKTLAGLSEDVGRFAESVPADGTKAAERSVHAVAEPTLADAVEAGEARITVPFLTGEARPNRRLAHLGDAEQARRTVAVVAGRPGLEGRGAEALGAYEAASAVPLLAGRAAGDRSRALLAYAAQIICAVGCRGAGPTGRHRRLTGMHRRRAVARQTAIAVVPDAAGMALGDFVHDQQRQDQGHAEAGGGRVIALARWAGEFLTGRVEGTLGDEGGIGPAATDEPIGPSAGAVGEVRGRILANRARLLGGAAEPQGRGYKERENQRDEA